MSGTIEGGLFDSVNGGLDLSPGEAQLVDQILESLGINESQLSSGSLAVVTDGGAVLLDADPDNADGLLSVAFSVNGNKVFVDNLRETPVIYVSGDDADDATISGIVQAFAGAGNDVTVYVSNQLVATPNAAARVDGEATLANLYGNQGDDQLTGGVGVDALYGGQGADTVIDGGSNASFGNRGDDLVVGSAGDDVLYGNQDTDVLNGGAGDDTLYGGQDRDALTGSAGDDLLIGGQGADTYVYLGGGEGNDVVNGFVIGEDVIQVTSAVAGDTATLQSSGIIDTPGGAQVSFADGTTVTLEGLTAQDVLDNFDSVFSIV